jgi:hypothetical protein
VPEDPHPGSFDVDLGVELGIADSTIRGDVEAQLGVAGFGPGLDRNGRETRDTWRYPAGAASPRITVDLIEGAPSPRALPEIRFAFADRDRLLIDGADFANRAAEGALWVCGIAAFVLLKGLAFHRRREGKDAFDIHWCLRHWPNVLNALQQRMAPFLRDKRAREILGFIADDFQDDGPGSEAAARFATGTADDELRAARGRGVFVRGWVRGSVRGLGPRLVRGFAPRTGTSGNAPRR